MKRMRDVLRFTLAATGLAIANACGIVDTDADEWRQQLEDARARWNAAGLADYDYTVRQLCFCIHGGARVRVAVRDGEVVAGTLVDTGEAIELQDLPHVAPSVDDLFDRIDRIVAEGPHEFSATYHPQIGHPVFVSADPIENAVDEEWGVEVTDLEAAP